MIELRAITKTYKLKSGDVQALKDINMTLPDKGMVFILGKSGCGKTTLLNIIGGLDNYTSGEILIDGVSLERYNSKDFDDYRNKYIGFIFQEYNLIDNFNVEDNVALALELQKQKAKSTLVDNALEQVGLQGYNKRHIKQLSGGQKQRVAIARAIIKNPSVILADEPTGNLDSITAEEVFDILKKLSEERLIIVVSHDRESAEKYADRIIELKDGEITSDTILKNKANEDNAQINSTNKEKQAGNLPFGRALRYAMSNLWHKKIRVTVSILLFIITLGLFNFSYATNLFDVYKTAQNTFKETDPDVVYLKTYLEGEKYDYVEEVFKEEAFPIYRDRNYYVRYKGEENQKPCYYYNDKVYYSMAINQDILDKLNLEMLYGRLPQTANEVCISKYKAESILYIGKPDWDRLGITDIKQLVGKKIDDYGFEIVGIIDTKFPERYNEIKETISYSDAYDKYYGLTIKFTDETDRKLHGVAFYHESYYDVYYVPMNDYFEYNVNPSSIFSRDITTIGRNEGYFIKEGIGYKKIDGLKEGVLIGKGALEDLLEERGFTDEEIESDIFYILENNEIMLDITYDSEKYYFRERVIGYLDKGGLCLVGESLERIYDEIGCIEAFAIDSQNTDALNRAIEVSNLGNQESTISFNSIATNELEHALRYAILTKQVCGIACPIFAVMVVLLLLNYFMSTIKDKNVEIGIMRALGVKTSNMIGIYLLQAVIICMIAFIVSLPIASSVADWEVTATMNSMPEGYDVTVDYIFLGFESSVITLIMALGVAILGCLIPFIKLGRMKPMEIIRQK